MDIEEEWDPKINMPEDMAESNNDDPTLLDAHEQAISSVQLKEDITRRLKLYRTALNGDWVAAKRIFKEDENVIRVTISENQETVLHIATGAKRIDFVKELVKKMNEDDLAMRNMFGETALFIAASYGMVDVAEDLMKYNKAIAMIPDKSGTLPIAKAASLGHKDMVEYLYQETQQDLKIKDRKHLFFSVIESDLYDFALHLLKDYPDLATALHRDKYYAGYDEMPDITALHLLARKGPTFSNGNRRGIVERCFNLVSGVKDVENKKQQALELIKFLWKRIHICKSKRERHIPIIFDAAKRGNVEFLSILVREYPDLIRRRDGNGYSIFHHAVMNRQKDVFKLIYEIGATKDLILLWIDFYGNTILHLAGQMPPTDALNTVSGSMLQMQTELLWFQEVEKAVQPSYIEARNGLGYTAREVFSKSHEGLRDEAGKWMKEIAGSCMVVATLITGVAFAAAISVPGGNNQDTGFPLFIEKVSFKIFSISDAISLVFSSVSTLNFLSIFTSSFEEEDFLWWLPRQLRLGLATLFISIASMMVVFSTVSFIFFKDTWLWLAILVTAIASTPVVMFLKLLFKHFYYVVRSTHVSYSLFQRGKSNLFREEDEEAASDQPRKSKILKIYDVVRYVSYSLFKRDKSSLFLEKEEASDQPGKSKILDARSNV